MQNGYNKTIIELKSDWQDLQVELQKSLHGYEAAEVNEEIGSIDYVTGKDSEEKKLLRVIVDPDLRASKADFNITSKTLEDLEDGRYDEIMILASGLTESSKRLVGKERDLEYISPKNEHYSLMELIDAIQKQTRELCIERCGTFPKKEKDCKGYRDGEYTCPVRRISDDADFHSERRWLELLMNDFSKLISLHRENE